MDVVIMGVVEFGILLISMVCFDLIRVMLVCNEEFVLVLWPFDGTCDGFVMGEGGVVFVFEEFEHVCVCGACVYCEIIGYVGRGNAFHMIGFKPDGLEMLEVIMDVLC